LAENKNLSRNTVINLLRKLSTSDIVNHLGPELCKRLRTQLISQYKITYWENPGEPIPHLLARTKADSHSVYKIDMPAHLSVDDTLIGYGGLVLAANDLTAILGKNLRNWEVFLGLLDSAGPDALLSDLAQVAIRIN